MAAAATSVDLDYGWKEEKKADGDGAKQGMIQRTRLEGAWRSSDASNLAVCTTLA